MRRLLIFLLLLTCASVRAQVSVFAVSTTSSGTIHYRTVTIDHTKVPNTDQTDFTIVISGTFTYLKNIANGGKVQNINGHDLTFSIDAAGMSLLNWEIEKYDNTTGELVVWIKISSLSHITDNVIYMRYGDPSITTFQGNVTGTWNSGYLSVWHMKETLTGSGQTIADATSNAKNITSNGTWVSGQQATGQVGGSISLLNASGDFLSFASTSLSTTYTIEGWCNISVASNTCNFFGNTGDGQNQNWFSTNFRQFTGSADECVSSSATTINTWTHFVITGTVSGNVTRVYQNGTQTGTAGSTARTFTYLGRSNTTNSQNIKFDEVRVSNVIRSADWITTEYNNMSSPSTFYAIGVEN